MNIYNIKDLVIVITGAAGQLGQAVTNSALKQGARVICIDLEMKTLLVASQNNKWDEKVFLFEADISKEIDIKNALDAGLEKFGRIDALVNNAGVSVFESWDLRSEQEFDWVTNVNLKGTFFAIKNYLKHLIKTKRKGSIVNVASFYGVISPDPRIYTDLNRRNSEVYGATKAGVIQMTKYFSVNGVLDGADVRVNSIAPGGILDTNNPQGLDFQKLYAERCPMKRMGKVEEMVGPILFLISSDSSYINGQTIIIDGGMSSW